MRPDTDQRLMRYVHSKNYDKTRLLEVLSLDDIVYDKKLTGTFESVSNRYKTNEEMFIFAIDETDKMCGYICFFPISDTLCKRIDTEFNMIDDNIEPQDVMQYNKNKVNNIFIISVAVFPEFKGKGIGFSLAKEMFEYLESLSNLGYDIGKIYATVTSNEGEKLLSKFNFHKVKDYSRNGILFKHDFISHKYMDLYLFVPVELNSSYSAMNEPNSFIELLTKTWKLEVKSIINQRINRDYLGQLIFCPEDDYGNLLETKKLVSKLYLSSYREIGTLIIEFQSLSHDPTSMLDQSSRNSLQVMAPDGQKMLLNDFLKSKGLLVLGNSNHLLVSGRSLNPYYRQFVLYAESYFNRIGSRIVSKEAMIEATTNIAQYEFAEIYSSSVGTIFELDANTPADSYEKRVNTSILMIFVFEIIALKLSSIRLLQNTMTNEFDNSPKPSIDIIEQLIDNYGRYMVLFEYNYKYHLAKCLSDKIDRKFGIQEMRSEYQTNLDQLNRIVTIRTQKATKDSSRKQELLLKVISIVTLLHSINQVVSLLVGADLSTKKDYLAFIISVILWGTVVTYLIIMWIKKLVTTHHQRKSPI
jgi:ribosomal protein S18 acetylase RimI-like enzyme